MRRLFLCCSALVILPLVASGCTDSGDAAGIADTEEAVDVAPSEEPAAIVEPLPEPVEEEVVEAEPEPPKPAPRKVKPKAPAPAKKALDQGPKGVRRASLSLPMNKPSALSSAQIKAIISERVPQVRACYERELKGNSQLEGKVTVAWTIREDGSVVGVRIKKNTTGDRGLASCVKKALSKWRFPASRTSSDIEYPFVFRKKETWR